MTNGEFLARATIWITILGYLTGAATFAFSRGRYRWESVARIAWTAAFLSLLAHVASAFHFYHGWSHTAAYYDTARQTNDVVGVKWGVGLYINYLLLMFWFLDISWWWISGLESCRRRPWPLMAAWHGFLLFIIFNATVVFKTGIVRWVGLFVCLGLCIVWWVFARDISKRISISYGLHAQKD